MGCAGELDANEKKEGEAAAALRTCVKTAGS